MNKKPNANSPDPAQPNPPSRVIGLDSHPDSFTAAVVVGPTPAGAVVEQMFNKLPIARLQSWAKAHTRIQDQIVLEASGNSFEVVRSLQAIGRNAKVLESAHLGKLKEAHANNDKISAVRIAKAYLAGTAKEVWVPDSKTQERRDWMHGHRKGVKRTTQLRNRIQSYLSDNGVRLDKPLAVALEQGRLTKQLKEAGKLSAPQQLVLEIYESDLCQAQQQRGRWVSLMAQEVLTDPQMLSLVRLCGVRDIVAFSVVAIVGDIKRFATPKKLVKYVGLNPAFDDSGEEQWSGGIGGHGRKDLRGLLIESAQAIMRTKHPLGKWGCKLLGRTSSLNLAVAAVARKLVVAIWYLLMGKWTTLEEIDQQLVVKISKILLHVDDQVLQALGKERDQLRQGAYESLKQGRIYTLDPSKRFTPLLAKTTPAASPKAQAAGASLTTVCPHCGKTTAGAKAGSGTKGSAK
jgi:transposase